MAVTRARGLLAVLLAVLAACGSSQARPAQRATVTPSGLRLVATLDRSRLEPGSTASLRVELRNQGAAAAALPADGPCSPALVLRIEDAAGRVVWAQPVPMCFPASPLAPESLAPGAELSAERCFRLAPAPAGQASSCAALEVPPGAYRLHGSFHDVELPGLDLTVAG